MREIVIGLGLERTLKKLHKKDPALHTSVFKKIAEIAGSNDVEHYKNLKRPLSHLKRVHIRGPFVLTFCYDKAKDKITIVDFGHHDIIYKT